MVDGDLKGGRCAGILFPVFSMRRVGDLGIGDVRAVEDCLRWFGRHGVGFLQLLPINVCGSGNSPYSAISSVALDSVYLDVLRIEGISQGDVDEVLAELGGEWMEGDRVDYVRVRAVKGRLLREGFSRFEGCVEFDDFCEAEGDWLWDYCRYRWLIDEADGEEDWMEWPECFGTAEAAMVYEREHSEVAGAAMRFYAWEQWHAFRQWRGVRAVADEVGVRLMGDVPIGVSSASADVFFEREWFDLDWFGGAPPETVFKDDAFTCKWGQNWGVPLYDWEAHRRDDFGWWRRRIGKLTDVFHIFRIDHILGFYRIYAFPWHPKRNGEFLPLTEEEAMEKTGGRLPHFRPRDDDSILDQARNLLDGDAYLRAVIEAADGAEVVGEDLGCVPDYVRPHLEEIGVPGFKICHWEVDGGNHAIPPEEHIECAFATYATHDHAPILTMWEELRAGVAAGEVGCAEGLKIICEFAGIELPKLGETFDEFDAGVKWAMLDALMRSGARYAALMIHDLLDSPVRINMPGTVGAENWSHRMMWDVDEVPEGVDGEMGKLGEVFGRGGR